MSIKINKRVYNNRPWYIITTDTRTYRILPGRLCSYNMFEDIALSDLGGFSCNDDMNRLVSIYKIGTTYTFMRDGIIECVIPAHTFELHLNDAIKSL